MVSTSKFSDELWEAIMWRLEGLMNDDELFEKVMDILLDESIRCADKVFDSSVRAFEKPKLKVIHGGLSR